MWMNDKEQARNVNQQQWENRLEHPHPKTLNNSFILK